MTTEELNESRKTSEAGVDVETLRDVFRSLHRGPMQAIASIPILLAVWERAIDAGDLETARESANVLAGQVRSIAPMLQEIERKGLTLLKVIDADRS